MVENIIINGKKYFYHSISDLKNKINIDVLPFTIRILLENVLRKSGVENCMIFNNWEKNRKINYEIKFFPARILMQDYTGVPAIVDLAAMRDAMSNMGKDPKKISPQIPVTLVIDHSIQVDFNANDHAERGAMWTAE